MHREPPTAWSGETTPAVGVLGATSFVGRRLLARLRESGHHAAGLDGPGLHDGGAPAASRRLLAFSRSAVSPMPETNSPGSVHWHRLPADHATWREAIPHWVAVCPLWAVAEHFPLLEAAGARRLVALSSTSRFTKRGSTAGTERSLAVRLAAAEDRVIEGARVRGIVATILRPTMIYDGLHDRNVSAIAGFIRRYGFFPVAGAAEGLRQPVHADDVVTACQGALACEGLRDAYELSGAETLSYREMVRRIFGWLDRPPRVVTVPVGLVRSAAPLLGRLPGLGSLAAMAVRMNDDLVFGHAAATRDFGFQPRPFALPLRRPPNHAAVTPDQVRSP